MCIFLSLDTLDPEHYRFHRNRSLHNVERNIREIARQHNEHCIKTVTCVVTKWSYKDVSDVIRFAGEHNIDSVNVHPVSGNVLKKNGYGDASIFNVGYTDEIHDEIMALTREWEKIGKESGVVVMSTKKIRTVMARAKKQYGRKSS